MFNLLFEIEDEKHHLVQIKDKQVALSTVDRRPSTVDLIVTTNQATYIAIETGKLNPQEAFMSGKVQVSDLGKMMQFGTLFQKFK